MTQCEVDAILRLQSAQSSYGLHNMIKFCVGTDGAYDIWSSLPAHCSHSISRSHALAQAINSLTLAASLRPGAASTPVTTSTPQGRNVAIASATLAGFSPPAAIRRFFSPARWKRAFCAAAQSKVVPVPPVAVVVLESTSTASTYGFDSYSASWAAHCAAVCSSKWTTQTMRASAPSRSRRLAGSSGFASKCNCTPVKPQALTVETISSTPASTNTPILSTVAGRRGTIAATCSAVTRRGLGANTNPTASAPASAASSASSSEVLPQILIQMLIRPRLLPTTP